MAKEFAKKFYNSKVWRLCRKAYIESVNGLCELCAKKGKCTPGFIVHHKIELTPTNINDPNVALNFDNLEYDCLDCHNRLTMTKHNCAADGLMFDENGNLIEV